MVERQLYPELCAVGKFISCFDFKPFANRILHDPMERCLPFTCSIVQGSLFASAVCFFSSLAPGRYVYMHDRNSRVQCWLSAIADSYIVEEI